MEGGALSGESLVGLPADVALPRLVDRHGGKLYGLAVKLCGDPADAEELVQEVFLNAFRKWDQFQGDAQPSTWLYTIAARACQRHQRRRAGQPRRLESLAELLPGAEAQIPAVHDDPLGEHLRREARKTVEQAVAALPLPFRLPLVLKEIVELPVSEVAAILGLKEATVKTRLHRARLLLRKALAETLPKVDAPPPDHERQVCLDLLAAKQEALDRGVPFNVPREDLCERCRSLFATLDLAHEACRALGEDELSPRLAAVRDLASLSLPVGTAEEMARESVPSPEELMP